MSDAIAGTIERMYAGAIANTAAAALNSAAIPPREILIGQRVASHGSSILFDASLVSTGATWRGFYPIALPVGVDEVTHVRLVFSAMMLTNSDIENSGNGSEPAGFTIAKVGAWMPNKAWGSFRVTFNGSESVTFTNGKQRVVSDPIPCLGLVNGSNLEIRVYTTGQLNNRLKRGRATNISGDSYILNDSVDATSASFISPPNNMLYAPDAIIGIVRSNRPHGVVCWGDSIMAGTGDSYPPGQPWGMGVRACGTDQPFVSIARSGETLNNWRNLTLTQGRRNLALYGDVVIGNMGTNDVNVATNIADADTIWTRQLEAVDWFLSMGKRYVHCTMTPRTRTSDAFATVANQWLFENAQSTGTNRVQEDVRLEVNRRWRSNEWVTALGAPAVNRVFVADTNFAVALNSAGNPDRDGSFWSNLQLNSPVGDGIHPTPLSHAALSVPIREQLLRALSA
jgi:lysophospholipase L1-like esterase